VSNLWSRRSLLRNAERHAHAFAGELPVAPALELAAVLPEPPASAPIRLRSVAERDALLRELVENADYIDPITASPTAPSRCP
jgi:hypothetical protein